MLLKNTLRMFKNITLRSDVTLAEFHKIIVK